MPLGISIISPGLNELLNHLNPFHLSVSAGGQIPGCQATRAVEDGDSHYSAVSYLFKQSLLNPLVGSKQEKNQTDEV